MESISHCQSSQEKILPLTLTLFFLPGQDVFLHYMVFTSHSRDATVPALVLCGENWKWRENWKWKSIQNLLNFWKSIEKSDLLHVGWTYHRNFRSVPTPALRSFSVQLPICHGLGQSCQINFPNRPKWQRRDWHCLQATASMWCVHAANSISPSPWKLAWHKVAYNYQIFIVLSEDRERANWCLL